MRHYRRLSPIVWFVVLALVASCTPAESNPPSQAYPTSPSLGPLATPTAPPAASHDVSFSGKPPAWLSDPAVDVLAVAIGDEPLCSEPKTVQLLFMNAETGEEFDLTITPARAMLWLDSKTFGLLSMDGDTILSISLTDGSLDTTSLDAEGIRLLSGTEPFPPEEFNCMAPLDLVHAGASGEGGLVFVSPRANYSVDLALFADGESLVRVSEVRTGALVWSSDPDPYDYDDTDEFDPAWSPVKPTHLAVSECKVDIECQLERLFVVDVAKGEQVASYPGQFINTNWSRDGSTILYQIPFALVPCVLDLATGDSECFWEVIDTHFPGDTPGVHERELSDLRWDRHEEGFFYVFQFSTYGRNDLGIPVALSALGGLCHFEIVTRHIDCPSETPAELQGKEILNHQLSPDEMFAYVQVSRDDLVHGILDLKNGRFIELPNPPGDNEGAVSVLWRPPSLASSSALVRTAQPTRREAQDIPSLWAFYSLTEGLDLTEPGTRSFAVDVDPASTFIWPYYWCAADEETLADNLRSITVDFMIDGVEVPATDLLEYKMLSAEWDCQFWATTLSGWESGSEPSLVIRYNFSQDVFDGVSRYPAGDYTFEIAARVND